MMRRLVIALAWIALTFVPPGARAEMEGRVALVVGNGEYQHLPRLDNPTNDAQLVAATLKGLGFTLIGGKEQTDLDQARFLRAIREFGAALMGGSVGLFYYAGHGVQVQGSNYLVPVSANPTTAADIDFEMIDAGLVLKQMEAAGSKLNFVILDACRNNPFGGRGLRASGGGLAQMNAPTGTLISYATQPGHVALDGTTGHSPYTLALAEAMRKPGLRVLDVFNEVGLAVDQKTQGQQQPWQSSSPINGDFYFLGSAVVTAPPAPPPFSSPIRSDAEIVFWQSIAQSNNPADFQDFLRQFPSSQFTSLAQRRMAALQAPPERSAQVETEPNWNLEQRREIQRALRVLGHHQGDPDGGFGSGTQAAIRQFQSFKGAADTGALSQAQHDTLIDMAQRLSAALDQPTASPQGIAGAAIKGSDQRYARAWNYDNAKGVRVDPAEAAYWYALAATDGDARALTNLGTLIARGWPGSKPDPDSAALLWWAAAARGEAIAMYDLGICYERGIGVTADPSRARAWYSRAADRNHPDARGALRRLGG